MRDPSEPTGPGAVPDDREVVTDNAGSFATRCGAAPQQVQTGLAGNSLSNHGVAAVKESEDDGPNRDGMKAGTMLPDDGGAPGHFVPPGNRAGATIEGNLERPQASVGIRDERATHSQLPVSGYVSGRNETGDVAATAGTPALVP